MIAASVEDRIPVKGTRVYPGQTEPATFCIAPLTVRERSRANRELMRRVGSYPTDEEMRERARDAVPVVFPPETQPELLAFLDELEEFDEREVPKDEVGREAHAKEAVRLSRLYDRRLHHPLTRSSYEPFKQMVDRRLAWGDEFTFVRIQFALRGWDNGPGEFRAQNGMVDADLIDRLSAADFDAVAAAATAAAEVSKDERKN